MDATKQNQPTKAEKVIPAASAQEIIEPGKLRVIKRNGKTLFNIPIIKKLKTNKNEN